MSDDVLTHYLPPERLLRPATTSNQTDGERCGPAFCGEERWDRASTMEPGSAEVTCVACRDCLRMRDIAIDCERDAATAASAAYMPSEVVEQARMEDFLRARGWVEQASRRCWVFTTRLNDWMKLRLRAVEASPR